MNRSTSVKQMTKKFNNTGDKKVKTKNPGQLTPTKSPSPNIPKPRKTTEQQNPEAITKLPEVEKVTLCLNEQNPTREVIVNWEKPEIVGSFHYEVHLECDKGSNRPENANEHEREKIFKNLRSETTYTAYVSINQNGKESKKTSSNPIVTGKALLTNGFDITEVGHPKIEICAAVIKDGNLESQFTWNLPDLGEDKNNFKVMFVQAFIAEEEKKEEAMIVEHNSIASPLPLEFMKKYKFTVRCTYLDIDADTLVPLQSTECCNTGIGTPVLKDVSWDEKRIIVDWDDAKGASHHVLKILNINIDEPVRCVNLKDNKRREFIEMSHDCGYGKTYSFVIEANAAGVETKKATKTVFIGGRRAVTNVKLEKAQKCPRRGITLSWKPPEDEVQGYEIKLYQLKKKLASLVCEVPLESNLHSHRFVALKTNTSYICKVHPRYNNENEYGTISNLVETEKRITSALETEDDFGLPVFINDTQQIDNSNLNVTLEWSQIKVSENYKIKNFAVEVFQTAVFSMIKTFSLKWDDLPPTTQKLGVKELKGGQKYDISFTTKCIDLDSPEKPCDFNKSFHFCTSPNATSINDCKLSGGLLLFSWEPVEGATEFRLIIKDEMLEEKLAEDEKIHGNKCQVKVEKSEKLRIGKTCMTKVITHANNLTSETDWKAHLIGGTSVPRNVHVTRNTHDPKRSMFVAFDVPKQGPGEEYKIQILPEYGNNKHVSTKTNNILIKYLRKGIRYKFLVQAKHAGKWSEGAESIPLQTDEDQGQEPVFNISDAKQSSFDMKGSKFTGNSVIINGTKGDEFGKVRELASTPVQHEKNDKEMLELSWNIPSFDMQVADYKVENYKVKIKKRDSATYKEFDQKFDECLQVYKTNAVELNLGEIYEILVSTIYIDIDGDEEYISSAAKITVQTKPEKPSGLKCKEIKNDVGDDALQIEWNTANGAVNYEVEIHTKDSKNNDIILFKHNVGNYTKWVRTFDEEFGFGTSYHAVITAIGSEKKTNSAQTKLKTIGGNFAPKKVIATIDHEEVTDPNTQIYLSWEQPTQKPESYEITSNNTEMLGVIKCNKTEKLITGLKAGVYYTFRVCAIHEIHKKRSGNSVSNRLQTNPTPTQVKDVKTVRAKNPSTSVKIAWSKVDAEKKEESTIYCVIVAKLDEKFRTEVNVLARQNVIVDGLLSGTKYYTIVSGGNSAGFGKPSEKVHFETELGTPKEVQLNNNTRAADSSLILQFLAAEGEPEGYFGNLVKVENRGRHEAMQSVEVQTGHVFNDLEPNTKYIAVVYAVFKNETQGEAIESEQVSTAPPQPRIQKYGRVVENEINSCQKLFLNWEAPVNCQEHEILIKHLEEIELQTNCEKQE